MNCQGRYTAAIEEKKRRIVGREGQGRKRAGREMTKVVFEIKVG